MKDTLKKRWLIDATLLVGFLVCFFLDLTGLVLHQWLGIAAGALAAYHLLSHGQWVSAVTRRFFGKTSPQARLYYLIDALLLAGFATMIGTGLVISSWLNLTLANYAAWRTVHILASMVTLLVTVLKIGLHQGWILSVGKRVFTPAQQANLPLPQTQLRQPARPQPMLGRRAFLELMGGVGIASLFALSSTVQSLAATSSTETTTTSSSTETTGSASTGSATASTASTTSCTVRCTRGASGGCPFPGRCGRYQDSTGNGKCDLGECA